MGKKKMLNLEPEVCTEEMLAEIRKKKELERKRADAMQKVVENYKTYTRDHDGVIDRDTEMKICKPYLDAVWEDREYARKRNDEQSIQRVRINVYGGSGRSAYREKVAGKFTDNVVNATDTVDVKKIDGISKSLKDISEANEASAKRVRDYAETIEIRKQQTELALGNGTTGGVPHGKRSH